MGGYGGPSGEAPVLNHRFPDSFQEDLSRLRRKLEKQKKVEMYTDADEILQEEINQYKVREFSHHLVAKRLQIHRNNIWPSSRPSAVNKAIKAL